MGCSGDINTLSAKSRLKCPYLAHYSTEIVMNASIEADYIVIGAGISGLAFIDTLLAHSSTSVAVIDQYPRPGGHWNEAYSFVRLHLPSHYYGVNSLTFRNERQRYTAGLNAGLYHQASAPEILSYCEEAMDRIMASGRVSYFPNTSFDWTRREALSPISGVSRRVVARKALVNGTASGTRLPSSKWRAFDVLDDTAVVPIRALPEMSRPYANYCVVGAGRTSADACLWLIQNGVEADRIEWIVPRDAWWINRAKLQFTEDTLDDGLHFLKGQMEAVSEAREPSEIFPLMETRGLCLRLDPERTPTQYHMATLSAAEHQILKSLPNVIRLGHLKSVSRADMIFEQGVRHTKADTLFIDCAQNGIAGQPSGKLFRDNVVSLSTTRPGRPSFSAAVLGLIEAMGGGDDTKNALAVGVPIARYPGDLLHVMAAGAQNTRTWMANPDIAGWIKASRLDPAPGLIAEITEARQDRWDLAQDVKMATGRALERLPELLKILGTAPPHHRPAGDAESR